MAINVNMTKKDLFNAKSASKNVKSALGNTYSVSGCAVVENGGTDKQGKTCDVGYIATNDGVFGFTSNVMLKGMPDFADYVTECFNNGEEVKIKFFSGTSKNGSEFFNFEII